MLCSDTGVLPSSAERAAAFIGARETAGVTVHEAVVLLNEARAGVLVSVATVGGLVIGETVGLTMTVETVGFTMTGDTVGLKMTVERVGLTVTGDTVGLTMTVETLGVVEYVGPAGARMAGALVEVDFSLLSDMFCSLWGIRSVSSR